MQQKTAEFYIKIYVTYCDADELNRELAVLGPHIIGKLIDHCGHLPSSSGYCHEIISGRVDKMKRIHPDYLKARDLISAVDRKYGYAALAWEAMLKRRPDKDCKVLRTGKDIARYLNSIDWSKVTDPDKRPPAPFDREFSYETFKKYRCRGIDLINAEMGVLVA